MSLSPAFTQLTDGSSSLQFQRRKGARKSHLDLLRDGSSDGRLDLIPGADLGLRFQLERFRKSGGGEFEPDFYRLIVSKSRGGRRGGELHGWHFGRGLGRRGVRPGNRGGGAPP